MNGDAYFGGGHHDYMTARGEAFARFVADQVWDPGIEGLDHAIELGAGAGRFTPPLAARFPRLTLVEPVSAYADVLEQHFGPSGAIVVRQPAEDWFPLQPLDRPAAVFAFHVLHHMNAAQQAVVFDWIRASGSAGIFVEPNPLNPLILAQVLATPAMRFSEERAYLGQTRARMTRHFNEHGLRVTRFSRFLVTPPFLADRLLRTPLAGLVSAMEYSRFLSPLPAYQAFTVRRS